ncbi:MAG: hypothetical protein V1810_00865 [Candidatus Beckwithbacteria bacterium]
MSAVAIIQKFKDLNLKFITPALLSSLLNQTNNNTLYKTLQRLEKNKILTRLDKGKYLVTGAEVTEFSLANFLLQPSYISLESALTYYGILPQFTYTITSITTQRSQSIPSQNWEFNYSKISSRLFWGYIKQKNELIALPEKACLDYLYLAAKGLRNTAIDEWNLAPLNKTKFKLYAGKIHFSPLKKLLITKKLL